MPQLIPEFFYFDLGNVLLKFDHQQACEQMAEVAGVPSERIWQILFTDNLEWDYERGDISSRQFYERFCQTSETEPDYDRLLLAASDIFELNVPIVPIVSNLHAAGYRLGILSNTCEAHWDFVTAGRYSILHDCFELYALSFKLNSMKPEPAIYRQAAAMTGVPTERIFYVDDREENVRGAADAGYDAVLYSSPLQLAEDLHNRGVRTNY